ncbi:MAG TPA: hypothetical protein VGI24_04625 [Solirubrobacteraceae bacterium]
MTTSNTNTELAVNDLQVNAVVGLTEAEAKIVWEATCAHLINSHVGISGVTQLSTAGLARLLVRHAGQYEELAQMLEDVDRGFLSETANYRSGLPGLLNDRMKELAAGFVGNRPGKRKSELSPEQMRLETLRDLIKRLEGDDA